MTKSILAIIYATVTIITFIFAFHAFKKKNKEAYALKDVLLLAVFNSTSYLITLLTNDYLVMSFALSYVYSSTVCLTYFLVKYAIAFTKYPQLPKSLDVILKWVTILDMLVLLVNPITEFAVGYDRVFQNGDLYLSIDPKLWFILHLTLCYGFIIFFVYLFIRKICVVADIYRKKYAIILLGVLIIVIINAFFVFSSLEFDVSIIGFSILASLIYYFSFHYRPKGFIDKVNHVIISNLNSPVFMFDDEHRCLYLNDEAIRCFPMLDEKKSFKQISEALGIDGVIDRNKNIIFEVSIEDIDGKKDYIVTYNLLYDKNNRNIGSNMILQDTTDKNNLLKKLHDLAYFDPLTGLYNHMQFNLKALELIQSRKDKTYNIIKFDIQRFKHINEVLGDKVGDHILCSIAKGLSEYLPEGGICGKGETDHFILCLEKDAPVLEYIHQVFKQMQNELNLAISIIPSIGIYTVEDRSVPIMQMCDWANLASHSVKGNYVVDYAYYKKEFSLQLFNEQEIINDLQSSLDNQWFKLYVQPQYHHVTQKVVGGEVLVRWQHPTKGLIPAYAFIPLFEKNGFIAKLDEYVWEQTCKYIKEWMDLGMQVARLPLSVNISRADFYYLNVEETLLRLTKEYKIPRDKLVLEITESSYTDDLKEMIEMVRRLQSHGFIVEMDDFGSGYSSLALLKDLPVNVIKVDMHFLAQSDDENNNKSYMVLEAAIKMLQAIYMPIIIEGVETKEQADFVSSLGCHTIQGFYYSKPIPIEDYIKLIKNA